MSGQVVKSPDTNKDAKPRSPITPPCHPRRFTRKPKKNFKQYEDLTTRKIKQKELCNEIEHLQDEIDYLYASFDQIKENEQKEYEKTYEFNSKFYPDKIKENTEDNDYFSKILCLEDEHFELNQQISFFTTLYSDKNIKKYEEEIITQQKSIEKLRESIMNLELNSELQNTSELMELSSKREQYFDMLNEKYYSYKSQLKEIKEENRQLEDIKEIMQIENNSVSKNRLLIKEMSSQLAELKGKREHLESMAEMRKTFGVKPSPRKKSPRKIRNKR